LRQIQLALGVLQNQGTIGDLQLSDQRWTIFLRCPLVLEQMLLLWALITQGHSMILQQAAFGTGAFEFSMLVRTVTLVIDLALRPMSAQIINILRYSSYRIHVLDGLCVIV